MRLVDAIRNATVQAAAAARTDEPIAHQAPMEVAVAHAYESDPTVDQSDFERATNAAQATPGMNIVRLELFLTQEQVHSLLRGALATHRAVMTTKEVASYLRLHMATVDEMAASGALPAFQAEGTWRFLKSSVDAWLQKQAGQEGTEHAA
ncbi:MAG: helix-turn-helix domain-containing protein [Chthonomonas sp.]|nr:helix-turn-helix domain-containing protein [Chthonomonas sp.]